MFEEGLAELHTHLGGSVASDIMWSLAHEQGIHLPTRDYEEFDRLVTVSDPRGVPDLDSLDRIYHLTELIQSSPLAVQRSVHAAIGGAYRSQRITPLELRFNPMKRNRGGERDLDHGILAARDPELMSAIRAADITLEICPTSNLLTKALRDEDEVRETFRTFVENGVAFTIATDGPEMMRTHLRDEFDLLLRIGALSQEELAEANARGHEASFVEGAHAAAGTNTPVGR